jgi:hypothetical protein
MNVPDTLTPTEAPVVEEAVVAIPNVRYEKVYTYEVKPGPVSGFMAYVTDPEGKTKGHGFWSPTREETAEALAEEAERKHWKVVSDGE